MSDDQVVQLANGKHVVIGDSKHTEWSIGVHDCAAQVGNAYSAIAKTFAEMDGHCTPEEKQFVLKIVQDMTAIFLTLLTG